MRLIACGLAAFPFLACYTKSMNRLNIQPIPAFDDNYIWLLNRDNSPFVALVDVGDADAILPILVQNQYDVIAVLLTHHHDDHTGGMADILKFYPKAKVYAPKAEQIAYTTHPLKPDDTVLLAQLALSLQVIDVKGHTRGHIAYYGQKMLFCGDALFTGGCGRVFEGTPAQSYQALERLAQLPDDTLIYCAHEYTVANLRFALKVEPNNLALQQRLKQSLQQRQQGLPTVPDFLALEKATNPFLRSANLNVITAAQQHVGHNLTNACAVFSALRAWKDEQ